MSAAKEKDFSKFRDYEFGGPVGGIALILFSHFLVYYLWIAVTFYEGALIYPHGLADIGPFLGRMWAHIREHAAPTWGAVAFYGGFVLLQGILYVVMPGVKVRGLPIPSRNNARLEYTCNGIGAWYVTLGLAAVLHFTHILPLTYLVDHLGSVLTVAVLTGNALAAYVFLEAKVARTENRASGNALYDFFMGINLNPRIGNLDIKMLAEIRISWILLFLVTCSAAAKQVEMLGYLPASAAFMVVAHFLYANACQKGEECIPTTWDIFHENFGWYLSFWNLAGVALTYSFQSLYLYHNAPITHSTPYTVICFVMLLGAYWIWDTANSQKNRFRMQLEGTLIKRRTFPQLPWGTLEKPEYLSTKAGSKLLVDGWYRYARKIHYTADVVMALSWGLICGFDHFLPYFYFVFFVGMITHRYLRDMKRMREKYGEDFEIYRRRVKYAFIPGVF
ncbi:MAG: delta(24(24(1)))-sterol reductase [Polyangiaceae bacterium]|nr:delta(24(24(1)))-sterol reductase [Polyangiaceae bacterium]